MWDTLTPQQQQWVMSLMGGGRPGAGMQQPGINPAMMPGGAGQGQPATTNPLLSQLASGGGMTPQQQAMFQEYLQRLNRPGGCATPGATVQASPYQGMPPIPGSV
jgi:hypothetical protein